MVDFNRIELFDHPSMIEVLVYFILPDGMLDVVVFDLLTPAIIKVVDLAGHLPTALEVIRFVDL
jgi:hypothetical protein